MAEKRTKGEIIKVDGSVEVVDPENGNDFSLEELKSYVGGYIEALYGAGHDVYMILNEEGKLKDLPVNPLATEIFRTDFGGGQDYIVGDVIIIPAETFK